MARFEGTMHIDEHGRHHVIEYGEWIAFCESNKGGHCEVIVSTKAKKSQPMHNYYWGVVVAMVRSVLSEMGEALSKEEVSEYIKMQCPSMVREVILPSGLITRRYARISARDYGTKEFAIYIEEARRWAAIVLDLDIPDPKIKGVLGEGD